MTTPDHTTIWYARFLLSYTIGLTIWVILWAAVPLTGDRPNGLRVVGDTARRHATQRIPGRNPAWTDTDNRRTP